MSDKEYTPVSPRAWLIFYVAIFPIIILVVLLLGPMVNKKIMGDERPLIKQWLEGDKTTQPAIIPAK